MRVLVVDDSAAQRRIQQRALESIGWQVATASDGQQALSELGVGACDLVLTDWHMPVMDGIALTKAIREKPELADTRIVMVTSECTIGASEEALAAGVNDLVMKPFTPDALIERLQEVMGG